jgi:hypothetical protein
MSASKLFIAWQYNSDTIQVCHRVSDNRHPGSIWMAISIHLYCLCLIRLIRASECISRNSVSDVDVFDGPAVNTMGPPLKAQAGNISWHKGAAQYWILMIYIIINFTARIATNTLSARHKGFFRTSADALALFVCCWVSRYTAHTYQLRTEPLDT